MSTLYYSDIATGHGAAGSLADVLNWWTGSGFTGAAGAVPVLADTVGNMQGTATAGTCAAGTVTTTGTCNISASAIFSGTISALGTSTVSGGTFNGAVTTGTTTYAISAGTFSSTFSQGSTGAATISGGTFNAVATFRRSVSGITIGAAATVTVTTTNGKLNTGCTSAVGSTITVASLGSITAGTYAGTITTTTGFLVGGTFNGAVTENAGEASGCTFNAAYSYTGGYCDYVTDTIGSNTFNGTASYTNGCSMEPAVTLNTYNSSVTFGSTTFWPDAQVPSAANTKSGVTVRSTVGTLAAGYKQIFFDLGDK